ncbi:hypothetical protein ACRRTK_001182 [Alexandromys fortis]
MTSVRVDLQRLLSGPVKQTSCSEMQSSVQKPKPLSSKSGKILNWMLAELRGGGHFEKIQASAVMSHSAPGTATHAQRDWRRLSGGEWGRAAPPLPASVAAALRMQKDQLISLGRCLFPALGSDALSESRGSLLSTNSSVFHISPRADCPACSTRWFVYGYHGDASLPGKGSAREGGRVR